jgi:TolC family type I secretion outer membrane protein
MTRRSPRMFALRCAAALAAVIGLGSAGASAQSLEQAMALAYRTNPALASDIANLRATNEQIAQALSGYRPTIQGSASAGIQAQRYDNPSPFALSPQWERLNPADIGISITQPIYSGGRTAAAVSQADNVIQATRGVVLSTEQILLFNTAASYANVVQARAVVRLSYANEALLARELQATRDRFNVGELTRTDVALSEASLAEAVAQRIAAEGRSATSEATYARIVGQPPGNLTQPEVPVRLLPGSLQQVIQESQSNNPQVITALFQERAAADGIDLAFGALLPTLSVTGSLSTAWDQQLQDDRVDTAAIVAQLSVPLYQAGDAESQVREARYSAGQARLQVEDARRQVVEAAIQAWEDLATARGSIRSLQEQVRAQQVAVEGVQAEYQVGTRTILDVLNAAQDLFDAQVNLVGAQRDEIIAAYQVLNATGRLTARQIGLPVPIYDPEPDYQRTRARWIGTSVDQ